VVRRLPGFSRQDGITTVPLELDPYGSAFIVFDRTKEARQSSAENFPEATVLARVEGPWKVTFEGLEAPEAPVVLDTLCDWTVSTISVSAISRERPVTRPLSRSKIRVPGLSASIWAR